MGMQDRDYYREDHASKNGMEYDPKTSTYSPKMFRRSAGGDGGGGGSGGADDGGGHRFPESSSSEIHWLLKILIGVALIFALSYVYKTVQKNILLTKVIDAQQEQMRSQNKRIFELEQALKKRPKVDFFK